MANGLADILDLYGAHARGRATRSAAYYAEVRAQREREIAVEERKAAAFERIADAVTEESALRLVETAEREAQ